MKIKKILIGLEIHVELNTRSKMFCGCRVESLSSKPNSLTCPVCLGLPGALPVPNQKAIEKTIILGLALNCQIPKESKFDRKNYFYPDLPKGYQISQYDQPFAQNGYLNLKDNQEKLKVGINRVHLEEDTGKSIHTKVKGEPVTLLDFNKSGIPLVEIVTQPDMHSVADVLLFCQRIRKIIRYTDVSSADLEKGQMRFEPTINLLISDGGEEYFSPLVEIKNINSFRFLKRALEYEIERQFKEFKEKRIVKSVGNKRTFGFDQGRMITYEQRHKEEADEYRYFPEPDIPPFSWQEEDLAYFKKIFSQITLPDDIEREFKEKYNLPEDQIMILTEEKSLADYFKKSVPWGLKFGVSELEIAKIMVNKRIDFKNLSPEAFVLKIKEEKGKFNLQEEEISTLIETTLSENLQIVEEYKKGKTQVLGFLIGLVQKKAKGKADPRVCGKILLEKLSQ